MIALLFLGAFVLMLLGICLLSSWLFDRGIWYQTEELTRDPEDGVPSD